LAAWDWIHQVSQNEIEKLNSWLGDDDRFATNYRVERKRFKEIDTTRPLMVGLLDPTSMLDSIENLRAELLSLPEKTRLALIHARNDLEVSPQDIGIGVSQLIPVLVAALDGADRLTAIEQPELHIHPALQVVLGDLFISAISNKPTLLLIETHSEHLLLRLLRRVREAGEGELPPGVTGLKPDQLSVIYVEDAENGATYTELPIDLTGEFTRRWPKRFFDERARELF
jgi:hypothetical protein